MIESFLVSLNLFIGFTYKLPQIWLVYKTKKTTGLRIMTPICDLCNNLIYVLYNVKHGYSFSVYVDYILYTLQTLVLFSLILHFNNQLTTKNCLIFSSCCLAIYAAYQSNFIMSKIILGCT